MANGKGCLRILHVDDDPSVLEISKQILMEINGGFEIDCACCVDEALKKLVTSYYDVIISDYEMPQKDGLQFLKELREQKNTIPFILFTGKGREEVAIKALNLGADGYINKQGAPETVYGELAHGIKQSVARQKNEQALMRSEEKYRSLFANMLNGYAYCRMVFDEENKPVDFVYLEVNDAFSKLTGLKKEVVVGKKVTEAIPGVEKVNPELFEIYGRVALTGKEEKFELFLAPLEAWLSVGVYSPTIGYFVAVFENITQRKQAEEDMRRSELILQNSSDSIVVTDLQGKISSWNKGAADIFGYSAQEMLGENITKLVMPAEKEQVASAQLETVRKGQVFAGEWEGVRKDGSSVWLILTTALLKNSQNESVGMVGFGKDVTEYRKTEALLRMSDEKTRNVLAASPDAITISDLNGRIVDCNQATAALHGYESKEELVGKNAFELIAKKDHNRALEKMAVQPMKNLELTFVAKDGHEFQAEMSTNIVMDALGEPEYFMAITKDITERKKMEKQLKDQERLASIGATAGMVGHDIRNPLQSIVSSLYLIKSDLDKLPESEEKNNSHVELSSILEEINYMDKIVSDLQDYARPLKLELVEVDVKMLVTGALSTLNVPDDVEAYAYFDAKLSKLITDPIILKRVLFNLASNAIQAMPEGGKLTICANMDKKASNLIITVEDTGVGIPKDVQDKLFTPLFTTKSKGQGFGLAVVKRMTEALGGTVTFESQEGKGTTFIVRLPPTTKR
jgi:PAS domain S-box-containing protein